MDPYLKTLKRKAKTKAELLSEFNRLQLWIATRTWVGEHTRSAWQSRMQDIANQLQLKT